MGNSEFHQILRAMEKIILTALLLASSQVAGHGKYRYYSSKSTGKYYSSNNRGYSSSSGDAEEGAAVPRGARYCHQRPGQEWDQSQDCGGNICQHQCLQKLEIWQHNQSEWQESCQSRCKSLQWSYPLY